MTPITVNRQSALSQLASLGYTDGDKVFLRFFFHSEDERKAGDKGRRCVGIYPNLPWQEIERYQNEGRGCYFVVNGQGDTDADVKVVKAVFFEHDDLSVDEQKIIWQKLRLPVPTIQIETGGKSIHSYWLLSDPVESLVGRKLQEDLRTFSKGDKSVINQSRVMRLAGAFYVCNDDQPVETTIYSQSNKTYSYDEMRALIPTETKKSKPAKRGFVKSGMTERGLVIAALNSIDPNLSYQDWLNVLMAGHSYDESLLDDFEDWSSRGDSYKDGEVAQKWQSFKSSGSIQIGTLFFYAVEAGFTYPANLSNELTHWVKSQVIKHSANQKNSFTPFVKRSLVLEDLEDIDFEEALEQSKKIARSKNAWQFVRNRFPKDIAENIDFFSSRTGIKPEIYALSFLTALSSVLNGKFSVECYKPTKWYEPLNIFFVAIGEPGTNKSSPLKLMVNYHVKKNAEYRAKFKEDKKQFDFDKSEYELNKKDKISVGELPPDAPVERFSSIGQATMEALIHVMQSQLHTYKTGLLQYQDELMTILGSLNKYNGGGDEVARLLEIFSGSEVTGLTLGRGSTGTDKACLSIMATTQPDSWVEIMSKLSKRNGFEDRFLVGEILKSDSKKINHLDHSEAEYDFDDFIKRYVDLFENLDSNQIIKVSHSADHMKNSIEDWYISNPTELAKSKSYIYRIAGILACMRDPNKPEILSEDLDVGWKFVCYSNACKASICATGNMTLGEDLIDKARRIFIKKGELTFTELKRNNGDTFRTLTKEELTAIIYSVQEMIGGELTINKQGNPKLIHVEAKAVTKLEKDYAKVIEPKPVTPVVEPIVELEPIVEQTEVDKPIEAELKCTDTGHIHIPTTILATRYQALATPNQQYRLIEESKDYYSIDIPGADKVVKIHKSKLVYTL